MSSARTPPSSCAAMSESWYGNQNSPAAAIELWAAANVTESYDRVHSAT
jgi:hypothetical protein